MMKRAGFVALLATILVTACGGSVPAEESSGGVAEAIGISGYWKVDIVNPDGSVERHVEFHNAFVGQATLASILAGDSTVNGWGIAVGGVEPICSSIDFLCRGTATATQDVDELVVVGETTATSDGEIGSVHGELVDDGGALWPFSEKLLDVGSGGPGVIPVSAGQTVQVEIRYSFG